MGKNGIDFNTFKRLIAKTSDKQPDVQPGTTDTPDLEKE